MKRRNLLFGTSAALIARPAFVASQIRQIAFIAAGSQRINQSLFASFHDGLASLGWTDGRNINVLDRWAKERAERLPILTEELVSAGVDLLVTVGTAATLAAGRTTTTTPIVFIGVGDPVAIGVVNSLAQPGGNVTGLSLSSVQLIAARFELLQELLPGLRRVAVLIRNDPGLEQRLLEIRDIANRMGIRLVEFVATTGRALQLAFRWLKSEPSDALYVASGPFGPAKRAEVIALAEGARIPAIYSFRVFAVAGGLMSLAADDHDLFRRAATFVDQILRGSDPAYIPVGKPTKFELVINRKAANSMGLVIPPALLARADELVE